MVPLLMAWVSSFFRSQFSAIPLLLILPVFYLLIISGIIQLPKKIVQSSCFLIILVINISSIYWFNSHPYFYREDWRSLVSYIESI